MAEKPAGFELFTIGVYGCPPKKFFDALESNQVRTFCDVRARRGVRGREYAYANSTRLQKELDQRGIQYLHLPELAPSLEVREAQWAADEAAHTPTRMRTQVAPAFAEGYRHTVLAHLDPDWFLDQIGPDPGPTVLFCLEREPTACHRSVLAEFLHEKLGVPVHHILP